MNADTKSKAMHWVYVTQKPSANVSVRGESENNGFPNGEIKLTANFAIGTFRGGATGFSNIRG